MGGDYQSQAPQPESQILQAYQNYLPGVISATSNQTPQTAQQNYNATALTQPEYNQLNLQQLEEYALPEANVGQQVTQSNALAGSNTNLAQLNGPGAQVASSALAVNEANNPDYYNVQNPASTQASNLLGAYNLAGLSPGEEASTERSLNQSNFGTGNLGNLNPTNTIANAENFGGAFNTKLSGLNSALGTATGVANSAQNSGFNPVSLALGQPNPSTGSNFGTGQFGNSNSTTSSGASSSTLGFGSSLMNNLQSQNNTANSGAYGLATANAVPNYIPNIAL